MNLNVTNVSPMEWFTVISLTRQFSHKSIHPQGNLLQDISPTYKSQFAHTFPVMLFDSGMKKINTDFAMKSLLH